MKKLKIKMAGLCLALAVFGPVQPAFAAWHHEQSGWFYERAGYKLTDYWLREENDIYYLQSDGRMATGWQQLNGVWYFFNPVSDGTKGKLLAGGWYWIDGFCYYFTEGGQMAADTTTPDGYTVNKSGAWAENGRAVYRDGTGIITSNAGHTVTSPGGRGSGGSGGGSGQGSNNRTEANTVVEPNNEADIKTPDVSYSYQILYKDIDTRITLKKVWGFAEKDFVIEIDHPFFENYTVCEAQPEKLVLNYNNLKETVYYKADITASDSNAKAVNWEVRFVDAETHQIPIAAARSGTIQAGETITINYKPQIMTDGIIWTALEKPPLDIKTEGFGNQIYYIEYIRTGEITEPEVSVSGEWKRLSEWLQTAREAESLITGERSDSISDSRFMVTSQSENAARIYSVINQIGGGNNCIFYLIGKNYIPNGTAITERFGAEYSIDREDTIMIVGNSYTVTRISITLAINPEVCSHIWELVKVSEAACLKKGTQTYACANCGSEMTADLPALGHPDNNGDGICDRCGDSAAGEAAGTHWNIGDIQAQELDGQIYFFECIDQNYEDEDRNHNQRALFLCTNIIPANTGSEYKYEKQPDGRFDYTFYPGPIVNFGSDNDYKYSRIRAWLKSLAADNKHLSETNIGVSYAYTGSTSEAAYEQFAGSELKACYIGNQKMVDKLFVLSVDEAVKYKEYLWKVEETGAYAKGYWLRNPMGTGSSYDSDYVYIVDVVNGNIRPQAVSTSGRGADEEINVTGTTGVRPAYTMPQE